MLLWLSRQRLLGLPLDVDMIIFDYHVEVSAQAIANLCREHRNIRGRDIARA